MNEHVNMSPLLLAKHVAPKIKQVMFKYSQHPGDVVRTSSKVSLAERIADLCPDDPRDGLIAAARYLGVRPDNRLFSRMSDEDEISMVSTNCFDAIEAAAEAAVQEGKYLAAICLCPDGYVFFGRTLNEDS